MGIKTTRWDVTEHLQSDEDRAAYLEAVLEDGDPALIVAAVGDLAKAEGMSRIANDAGLSRESLYRALSEDGNPGFATILKVLKALRLELHVTSRSSNSPPAHT
jgi:probable addiction module antidote protein